VCLYNNDYVRDLVARQNRGLTESQKHQLMNVKSYKNDDFKEFVKMFEKDDKSVLLIRCKDCGYESITHKNGEILKDDFIYVPNKNPFLKKHLCPKCDSEKHEYDHDKKNCGCIYCVEGRRYNGK